MSMSEKFRGLDHKMTLVASWLGLAGAAGCGADTVSIYAADCDDDAIGWALNFAGFVELPPAEFGVECANGWGHVARELVEVGRGGVA
jgi:hypothetical protein